MIEIPKTPVEKRGIFNEDGDIDLGKRKIIQGNTTNLNDFNNLRYTYTMDWYRQSMNNFWIPEEISLTSDVADYNNLSDEKTRALLRVISSFSYLDSLQTGNVPNLQVYITANEINLCLSILTYQEAIHSKAYTYILENLMGVNDAVHGLYWWKDDEAIVNKSDFIQGYYDDFLNEPTEVNFVKNLIASYIVEGLFFTTGYAYILDFGRENLLAGTVSELANIKRDEDKHLELFRNIINDFRAERPDLFTGELLGIYREIFAKALEIELAWVDEILADIDGFDKEDLKDYIKYTANKLAKEIAFESLAIGYEHIPVTMAYIDQDHVGQGANPGLLGDKVSSQTSTSFIEDDL